MQQPQLFVNCLRVDLFDFHHSCIPFNQCKTDAIWFLRIILLSASFQGSSHKDIKPNNSSRVLENNYMDFWLLPNYKSRLKFSFLRGNQAKLTLFLWGGIISFPLHPIDALYIAWLIISFLHIESHQCNFVVSLWFSQCSLNIDERDLSVLF